MHKKRTSIDPVRFQYTLAYSNYRGLIPAAVRHAERAALAAVDPGMCGDVAGDIDICGGDDKDIM